MLCAIKLKFDRKVCCTFEKTYQEKGTIVTQDCFFSFLVFKKVLWDNKQPGKVAFTASQYAHCPALNETPATAQVIKFP